MVVSCRAFMSAPCPPSAAPDPGILWTAFHSGAIPCRGNSWDSGPSVYNCSGGTAAETISLTRRSHSTSISQVKRRAGETMLTGM